jgi:predicted DNA-binding protein with PD1-like motif
MDGAERILHLHCCLSGPELITFSGHLFEGEVAVLAEFFLTDFRRRVDRRLSPELGLRGIDLGGAPPERREPAAPSGRRPRRRTSR